MLRLRLKFENCRGQCYDGANNMSGCKNGVVKQILDIEPRAIYTYCYGHALNLACQDTIRHVKIIKDALDTTFEISKLLKYSSKRNALYLKLKEELAPSDPGFRTLLLTRWTVRAKSLSSVIKNYSVLQKCLECFTEISRDMEMSARLNGIAFQLDKFDFLFGVMLGEKVLQFADNLSCTLQRSNMSAAEGHYAATLTCSALFTLNTNEEFSKFWTLVTKKASEVEIDEPVLPRKRRTPIRFRDSETNVVKFTSIEEHYKSAYFQTYDLIIECIKDRFNQPGYKIYKNLENLLLKSSSGEVFDSELDAVTDLYGSDFDLTLLSTQLDILRSTKINEVQ